MFRSERVLRIICFEPVFLAFNPGGCPQSHTGQGFSSCMFSCQRAKKSIVLGHFSFQFELWFFLIWSWSIPVGASEIRCSTRVFAVSKTAATDHSRHESAKCEQDSKSGSRASGSWVRIPPYPPRSRQQSVFPAAGVSFCAKSNRRPISAARRHPITDPLCDYIQRGAARQTTFAVYTARAMRLRAKNERSRCLPGRAAKGWCPCFGRILVAFPQGKKQPSSRPSPPARSS